MSAPSTQPFVWVGVTALVIVGIVVTLTLLDSGPVAPAADPTEDAALPLVVDAGAQPRTRVVVRALPDAGSVDYGFTPKHAVERTRAAVAEFRAQSDEDQRRLGDAYADMEKLWKLGRYGGANPASVEALEKLVQDYGDTHRAACARYLLARHTLRGGGGKDSAQDQSVAGALESLSQGNDVSRCDSGARVQTLSKFFLATQIYRHRDWDRSVELLEELAAVDPGEVDGLDVPISLRARGILQEVEQMER